MIAGCLKIRLLFVYLQCQIKHKVIMTAKYYQEKYPNLILSAAKIISAMESECKYRGKIFDKLAEIFSEYPDTVQNECVAILIFVMKRIWNKFHRKSLEQRNKERQTFQDTTETEFLRMCEDAHLDKPLVTHMLCAITAVWKSIVLDLINKSERIKFYNSNLKKFSKKLTA